MKRLPSLAAVFVLLAAYLPAHRLDQYLQAAMVSLEKDRVEVSMRMVPGVAVSPSVLAIIDTNADGSISQVEGQAYAEQVLRDLSLDVDGSRLRLALLSFDFPNLMEIREGLGEIQIRFAADLPAHGSDRKLIFQNHHQDRISTYLANCLLPRDRNIQILGQNRNENQSFYELHYLQAGGPVDPLPFRWWGGISASSGSLGGFPSMFRLGMRHIAEGTDHLLFLLVLLLPAPLLTRGSRWTGFAGVRHSLLQILKVVTAFTLGHSITLALAAFGLVRLPSRPIEVLIAFLILVSAVHALRPVFPGREANLAAFFGLIHGLAFASTLGDLGLGGWERFASILGFNLGIEAMQLFVVSATMPALLLLSRSSVYALFRVGGALFASFASTCWLSERLLTVHTFIGTLMDSLVHHAAWIAGMLYGISLLGVSLPRILPHLGKRSQLDLSSAPLD